jgi:hypothetical protein
LDGVRWELETACVEETVNNRLKKGTKGRTKSEVRSTERKGLKRERRHEGRQDKEEKNNCFYVTCVFVLFRKTPLNI